jgi:hypothetical protein
VSWGWVRKRVCVALMASTRLCASSISTTFPLSGIFSDSRVYGKKGGEERGEGGRRGGIFRNSRVYGEGRGEIVSVVGSLRSVFGSFSPRGGGVVSGLGP